MAPNGKIILAPFLGTYIGIYDPTANTYTNGPAHGEGTSWTFMGGVLAPNGKVILVPFASPNVGIYDPIANTYTSGVATGHNIALGGAFWGGVLAPNGKVIFSSSSSPYVGIYTYSGFDTLSMRNLLSPYYNKF